MSVVEKRWLQRKIKASKSWISKIKKERERQKSGISLADSKLLERNKSAINKQIKDSKTPRSDFKGTASFFKNLSQIKK